ncbi:DNA replication/checkpoint protein [Kalaharituber pfeilii]|nr:DNA replication/checkpoint protein [Kalaharituber pfeilii]
MTSSSSSSSDPLLSLRLELKNWESAFAAEHGRKPTRDDIKKAPEIAAKYKEYNKHRGPAPTVAPAPASVAAARSSRAQPPEPFRTPRKKRLSTVLEEADSSSRDDPFHSPSLRRSQGRSQDSGRSKRSDSHLETPTNPNRISVKSDFFYDASSPLPLRRIRYSKDGETVGPTPQKTGKVLGLFESHINSSPLKSKASVRKALEETHNTGTDAVTSPSKGDSCFETPRKRKLHDDDVVDSPSSARVASSTTNSVHRSHASTIIVDGETPKKRRAPTHDMFTTPTFLRRSSSRVDSGIVSSPPVPQLMKCGLVKGLSSLVADLRKMQDDTLDEEMDNLREIEREIMSRGKKPQFPKSTAGKEGNVTPTKGLFGEADGSVEGPGIADLTGQDACHYEEETTAEGEKAPVRIWKKKGLKRQTRRVKMRPVRNKPTSTIAQKDDDDEDSDAEDDKPANAGKEKFESANGFTLDAASDDDDVSNYSEVDDSDAATPKMEKPIGKLAKKTSTAAPSKFDTRPAKVARGKRSATASANYCKLKIRTQGGIKGRAGRGRFGKRR